MSDPSERVSVLVTGVGGGGIGEQILKALRLATTPYEIVGTDASRHSMGFLNVDHPYLVPPAGDKSYVDVVHDLCRLHNVRAVFPGSEPELRVLAEQRASFDSVGILLPVSPTSVIDTCLDKDLTMQFLARCGFATPRTCRLDRENDVDQVDFFPVVIKPYVGGGGSSDVHIAQDRDELVAFVRSLLANGRLIVAQEYVGTPDREFTVGVLVSMSGDIINAIALKRMMTSALGVRLRVRNRTNRVDLGSTLLISSGISQGEIGGFPDITGPCEAIATKLGVRGAVNIQCREVGGRVVVFEINPRFSGTTSLRAMVGYNEPDVLVLEHVLGQLVPRRFAYRSAVILRGLSEGLVDVTGLDPHSSDR